MYTHLQFIHAGIIEEVIRQHPEISAIYPHSVNTYRIVTVLRDGTAHVAYSFIRIGNGGQFVDNINAGGMAAPIDPETGVCISNTIQEQTQIVMEKLDKTLQECGTSLEYLIKDLIILKDMADYPVMRAVQQEYYRQHAPSLLEAPPGSTVFQAAQLVRPYYKIEIEAVAYIPEKEE